MMLKLQGNHKHNYRNSPTLRFLARFSLPPRSSQPSSSRNRRSGVLFGRGSILELFYAGLDLVLLLFADERLLFFFHAFFFVVVVVIFFVRMYEHDVVVEHLPQAHHITARQNPHEAPHKISTSKQSKQVRADQSATTQARRRRWRDASLSSSIYTARCTNANEDMRKTDRPVQTQNVFFRARRSSWHFASREFCAYDRGLSVRFTRHFCSCLVASIEEGLLHIHTCVPGIVHASLEWLIGTS